MKVVVDLTRCQGYAQCAFAAPDVFAIHGDEALLYDTDPDDAQREKVVRAAAACPVQAIFLDRDATRIRQPAPETHVTAPGPEKRSSVRGASSSSGRPWRACGPAGRCAGKASPAR